MTILTRNDSIVSRLQPRGFSLIEVLVAAALLALMGALIISMLSSSINIKNDVEKKSQRYHVIRQALSKMARDISSAFISKQFLVGTEALTQFNGSEHELVFSSFGHVVRKKNAQESDQQTLRFFLGKDERLGSNSLLRTYHPSLDTQGSKAIKQTLCREIISITFSYFNERKGVFVPVWDTSSTQGETAERTGARGVESYTLLPSRVRIKLSAVIDGDRTQDFYTEAPIWLTMPIQLMR